MRPWFIVILSTFTLICQGQPSGRFVLKGNHSHQDSIQISKSYTAASQAVREMYQAMNAIWEVSPGPDEKKKTIREQNWRNDEIISRWLGQPDRIGSVYRKIKRIHSKFGKKLILQVNNRTKGKCNPWVGAWAIPFGKIRIRLCENFFNSPHLQEKILVHEMGHEAGMLFHHEIHNCRTALWAANSESSINAKRSPENYAWLAVSYIGRRCY